MVIVVESWWFIMIDNGMKVAIGFTTIAAIIEKQGLTIVELATVDHHDNHELIFINNHLQPPSTIHHQFTTMNPYASIIN